MFFKLAQLRKKLEAPYIKKTKEHLEKIILREGSVVNAAKVLGTTRCYIYEMIKGKYCPSKKLYDRIAENAKKKRPLLKNTPLRVSPIVRKVNRKSSPAAPTPDQVESGSV